MSREDPELAIREQGWFFGFKLHVLRPLSGRVLNLSLTPGNWEERAPALTVLQHVDGGVLVGDLGYRGAEFAAGVAEEAEVLLSTRDQVPTHKKVEMVQYRLHTKRCVLRYVLDSPA